ncbi:MAG: hypothetical protein IRZ13_20260 [Acetobacteraceae bacterium]|nr:hypothetical protein [Acetobacteraceae bacterium]
MKLREFYARYSSWALGMSPQEAYELQRVLQMDERAQGQGLKATRSGPGGGAEATPFTVAFMLIGAMANGARADAIETVWKYWHIETEGSNTSAFWVPEGKSHEEAAREAGIGYALCPFTRQILFGEALRFLLRNPIHAALVDRIELVRGHEDVSIYWRDGDEVKRSRFIAEHNKAEAAWLEKQGALRVVCTLGGKALAMIACDLRKVTEPEREAKKGRSDA